MLNAESLSSDVELERDFVPGPFGQIHIRIARPKNRKALETPMFLFSPTPHSGDYFKPYMAEMAKDRLVVAIDTPGFGDSFRPDKKAPTIEDYATSAIAAIDELRPILGNGNQVDVLGYHTGGLTAVEVASMRPELVRRLVLPGFPYFTGDARKEALNRNASMDKVEIDGTHLLRKWEYSKVPMGAGVSLERTQEHFNDLMKSYPHTWQGYQAAFTYESEKRVVEIKQPVLLISIGGSLKEETHQASTVFPNAEYVHLEGFTFGIFDLAPEVIAEKSRKFLDS